MRFEEYEYILPESTSDGMGGYIPVCVELEGTTQRPVTVYVSTNDHGGKAIGLNDELLLLSFKTTFL